MIFAVPYTQHIDGGYIASVLLTDVATTTEAEQRAWSIGREVMARDAVEVDVNGLAREQIIEVWRGEGEA